MTRRGIILFVLLGVSWGIPYLLIKIAVGQLDPAMLVLRPDGAGRGRPLPVAAARGEIMPVLRRWRPLAAFTLAEIIVPQFLLSSAEERLPSSTTGLLIAAVPLAGVGVAFLLGRPERLAPLNWLGIALGMAGVAATCRLHRVRFRPRRVRQGAGGRRRLRARPGDRRQVDA